MVHKVVHGRVPSGTPISAQGHCRGDSSSGADLAAGSRAWPRFAAQAATHLVTQRGVSQNGPRPRPIRRPFRALCRPPGFLI